MIVNIFSFFSGAGFLDLGFEDAGFNIVHVNEVNSTFLKGYQYNRKKIPKLGYGCLDAREYLNDSYWEKMLQGCENRTNFWGIIGGPPCPDFSVAGHNKGEHGLHGQLTYIFFSLIVRRQPDFFVFENVAGLYETKKHRAFYERMKRKLYRAGYSLYDSLENSLSYGVAQDRKRLFLIGFNRKSIDKSDINRFSIVKNRCYDLELIKQISWPAPEPFKKFKDITVIPNNILKELCVQYWFSKNDVNNHVNQKDVFKVKNQKKYECIYEGDTSKKSFKRLHRWKYAPTAAFGNNEVYLHPYKLRRISVAEALAIQSLPIWYSFPEDISLSNKFKMIGNGVPYLMARHIADNLYSWFESVTLRR